MSYLAKTRSKGRDYYKVMESYRIIEGGKEKVKHRVLFNIGTIDKLFALLPGEIKNRNGAVTVPSSVLPQDKELEIDPIRCRIHGAPTLLYETAEWLGIKDLMEQLFPSGIAHGIKRSESLLLASIHRACEPGSKRQFSQWFRYTSLPDHLFLNPDVFTSQHFWEQMDDISAEEIKLFETEVFKRILVICPEIADKLDRLSSDFTNYYTYISNQNYRCTIAQLGHSKEGRTGQKIFNVAVVITPLLGIPIATMVYEGNINDKTALPNFMKELRDRLSDITDLEKMTFVFDGGGVSERTLEELPGHFITRGSLHSAPELYDVPLEDYQDIKLDSGETVSAYRGIAKQFGKQRTIVVTLSEELKEGQKRELDKQIGIFDSRLKDLNKSLANPKGRISKKEDDIKKRVDELLLDSFHLDEFIDITYRTVPMADPQILKEYKKAHDAIPAKGRKKILETGITVQGILIRSVADIPMTNAVTEVIAEVNSEKKKVVTDRYYGKHLLTTDHDDWETKRILDVYRDQENIERYFRDSKDTSHFSVRPTYHWTDQKLKVHVMLCYLSLSLCRLVQYLLDRDYGLHITCSKLMDRLEKVHECMVFARMNGEAVKPITTLSKLESPESEVWNTVSAFIDHMKKNPIDYSK